MEGKFVFAAAQVPFETGGNQFCTLVPICKMDGELVDAAQDFPNRGLCWFMLRDAEFQALAPGQLIVGPVEQSRDHHTSSADKDWWQLRVDSPQFAGAVETIIEIIDAGSDNETEDPQTLIEPQREFRLDHRPSSLVMVALGSSLYGPFRPRAPRRGSEANGDWRVTLERTSRRTIYKVDRSKMESECRIVRPPEVIISLEQKVPDRATALRRVLYEFMLWDDFERLPNIGAVEIELQTDTERLLRAAQEHLKPRAKRQQLRVLLDELVGNLRSVPEAEALLARTTATGLRSSIEASDRIADELLIALDASGALADRITGLEEKRFEAYIEARATEAEARISDRVKSKQAELETIESEVQYFSSQIEQERASAQASAEAELHVLRATAEAEIAQERNSVEEQREALRREQETLAATVERAAARFAEGRGELLSDLLALLPALNATGVLSSTQGQAGEAPAPPVRESVAPLPVAFRARHAAPNQRLAESAFFERFAGHAAAAGFSYRDIDLKAFHLSVKCGDLTVLGGLSGIGKSSLVRLYAEALAGDDDAARARLLVVDVSPAWTEPQDLLGSVNLLDRRFEPAACGVFNHIVASALEHDQAGIHAGLVLIALDEMNLAQVEHYLAGFLQALERPSPRSLAAFDPSALRADDPFRTFARLPLPPTLRIIGTVNFDETTRPLSQRLKDRAAILELGGERHAGMQSPRKPDPAVTGPPVALADVLSWLGRETPMPVEIAALVDSLNAHLLRLGAPITPRRMQAIRRLFAGGTDVLSPGQTFDIAIATRVLPLLRGLDRRAARDEAGRLQELLSSAPGGCPESGRRLAAMLSAAETEWRGILDEE